MRLPGLSKKPSKPAKKAAAPEAGQRKRGRNHKPWPEHLQALQHTQGMVSQAEASALYDYAKDADTGCIVEVGSYRGKSTVALALGTKVGHNLPVFAIDPHETFVGVRGGQFGPADRAAFYRAMLKSGAYEQVRLLNISSEVIAPGWNKPISFLFIDGDHSYEGVKRDFDCWSPHLTPEATVMFDDVNESGPNDFCNTLTDGGEWQVVAEVGKTRSIKRTT